MWNSKDKMDQAKDQDKEYRVNRKIVQKAMAYDLLRILREPPGKSYTYEELETLIDAYVSGLKQ